METWLLFTIFCCSSLVHVASSLSPREVFVNCTQNSVEIAINKRYLPAGISAARFHLLDPRCGATDNGTHVVAETLLSRCGCGQSFRQNGVLYSNTLFSDPEDNKKADSGCPLPSVSFKCFQPSLTPEALGRESSRLPRNVEKKVSCEHVIGVGPALDRAVLAKMRGESARLMPSKLKHVCPMSIGVGPALKQGLLSRFLAVSKGSFITQRKRLICEDVEGNGTYAIEMVVYSDDKFTRPIEKALFTDQFTPRVYYQLRLASNDPNLEIFPTRCFATPSKDPDSLTKYVFLQDGCILDSTVRFYRSTFGVKRFGIETFRFIGSSSNSFFVHCDTVICDVNDLRSRCAQGCLPNVNKRRKRGQAMATSNEIRQAIKTTCSDDRMLITLDKSKINPRLTLSTVHLNRKTCVATDNGTHYVFNASAYECGSILINSSFGVERRNMVYVNVKSDETSSSHLVTYPVVCRSERQAFNTGHVPIHVPSVPTRSFFITTTKTAWVLTRIVSDNRLTNRHATSVVHTKVTQKGSLLTIVNRAAFNDVSVKTMHCSINNSPLIKEHVTLLRHGCAHHHALEYKHSSKMEVLKIHLDRMSWPLFYVKCTIRACDHSDPISICNSFDQCNRMPSNAFDRQRRAITQGRLSGDRISVHCGSRMMEIMLPKILIPSGVETSNLRLRNSSCTAVDLGTHLVFRTPLTRCGTKSSASDDDNLQFFNQINEVFDNSQDVIIRRQPFQLPFRCFYVTEKADLETTFRLNNDVVKFLGKGVGAYSVLIKMFTGADFKTERLSPFTSVGVDKDMFFEVGIVDSELDLALFLDECYGAPVTAKSRDEKYTFIKDGCKLDQSVRFYPSGVPNRVHFSVKPFKFQRNGGDILYVNCFVTACNAELPNTKCALGCKD